MIVKWSNIALEKWSKIADYIFDEFGFIALQEYEEQTLQWEAAISNNPSIGAIEPLLQNRARSYRYVIIRHQTKLVYFVDNDTIVIANVWDTRREPKSQVKEIK